MTKCGEWKCNNIGFRNFSPVYANSCRIFTLTKGFGNAVLQKNWNALVVNVPLHTFLTHPCIYTGRISAFVAWSVGSPNGALGYPGKSNIETFEYTVPVLFGFSH
ncbi:hypothetical protein AVEN_207778-1 [Araneus ventricosus]|uniref:Uncharacterized protein n=1 Tax=Araneus ventricosus TaxID=182803 RepID=A0A4Y2BZ43_ARAVE|nr:hypothetical protein AVEN_207778-1 [Araneus ventricosus]